MAETIILALVIAALLVERVVDHRAQRAHVEALLAGFADERKSLLNRVESKHLGEFVAAERALAPRDTPEPAPAENGLRPGEHPVGI